MDAIDATDFGLLLSGCSMFIHVAGPDDTLAGIALRYSDAPELLMEINSLLDERLTAGESLRLPACGTQTVGPLTTSLTGTPQERITSQTP
jgi:hypothetical protein